MGPAFLHRSRRRPLQGDLGGIGLNSYRNISSVRNTAFRCDGVLVTAFAGRVAAVTGAASGIGRALACELAARGAALALSDIDDEGLAETVNRCAAGARVTSARVDVGDRDAV